MRYGPGYMSLRFELHNTGESYRFSEVEIHDKDGRVRDIEYLLPNRGVDGTFELARGDTLIGAIKVRNAAGLRSGWQLFLKTPVGVAPAAFDWDEERHRGPLEKRFLLAMRVAGGLANLDDGIGIDEAMWTTANALGILMLYGMWEHVTIEGTLDVGRTSDARFDDAVWDTTMPCGTRCPVRSMCAKHLDGRSLDCYFTAASDGFHMRVRWQERDFPGAPPRWHQGAKPKCGPG